jgi:hypothetical protein
MDKHNLTQVESHISSLKSSHAILADTSDWDELFRIIHQPGWTTIAEFTLVVNTLESIVAQTKQLTVLRQGLLAGAKAVGATRAAGAP